MRFSSNRLLAETLSITPAPAILPVTGTSTVTGMLMEATRFCLKLILEEAKAIILARHAWRAIGATISSRPYFVNALPGGF
jgi:hypothetical protein